MEEWRTVVGKSNYEVSNSGIIRNKKRGIILRSAKTSRGYLHTSLGSVHSVVAEAFLGPRPHNYVVDHIDNNKANNSVNNLQYVSRSTNTSKDSRPRSSVKRNTLFPRVRRKFTKEDLKNLLSAIDLLTSPERCDIMQLRIGH